MTAAPTMLRYSDCQRLERVFARCFEASDNTRLIGGAEEPLYLPAAGVGQAHCLYYREDYAASALHEIAHWCIAGQARRQKVDFGYWYAPEGRNAEEQRAFEQAEIKPQALEWFFTQACGWRFRISVDNFSPDGQMPDTRAFRRQLQHQARHYRTTGLPDRAGRFLEALVYEFDSAVTQATLRLDAADLA